MKYHILPHPHLSEPAYAISQAHTCNPVAICSNLCYKLYFDSATTPGTLQVFKAFWKKGFRETRRQEYFLWLCLELRAFILHMGLTSENSTCQSQVSFFFIYKVKKKKIAAAKTCPGELSRVIKTSPLLKYNLLKEKRWVFHFLSSVTAAWAWGGWGQEESLRPGRWLHREGTHGRSAWVIPIQMKLIWRITIYWPHTWVKNCAKNFTYHFFFFFFS